MSDIADELCPIELSLRKELEIAIAGDKGCQVVGSESIRALVKEIKICKSLECKCCCFGFHI